MEHQLIQQELERFSEMIDSFPASDAASKFYHIESIVSPIEYNLFKVFFGEEEYSKAMNLVLEAQEAIKKCKSGKLEEGYNKFESVNIESAQLTEKAQQYVKLYYLSGLAYYYFRKKDFDKAIEYTVQEIQETEVIEHMGATSLHYRRTGHVLNLIKIFKATNDTSKAIPLFLGALSYLLNGDSTLMPIGGWNSDLLNFIPYVRQRCFDIFFIDAVDTLIHYQADEDHKNTLIEKLFMQIPDFEPQNNNQAMHYNWLYLQRQFYQKNYGEFIKDCIEFCQMPFDNSFDSLKLSLLANIIKVSRTHLEGTNLQQQLIGKINTFIQTKLASPDHLKNNVCHLIIE
jgi:tetratricopeptide (TPR) repeat protein